MGMSFFAPVDSPIATRILYAEASALPSLPASASSSSLESSNPEIKKIMHSIGFYNVKAERIKQVSQILVAKYSGKVPSDISSLLELPGVGRKTANCVLVYAFDKPAIPVDVHVHRISNRLGLVSTKMPEQTELELSKLVDRRLWTKVNNTFVMYGQNICLSVRPNCKACPLKRMCRYYSRQASSS